MGSLVTVLWQFSVVSQEYDRNHKTELIAIRFKWSTHLMAQVNVKAYMNDHIEHRSDQEL